MAFLSRLSMRPSPRLVTQLGASIARQCYPSLRGLVEPTVLRMTPAEARGYVQALTGHVIRRAIDDAVSRYGLDSRLRQPLVQCVLDAVFERTLADLATAAPAALRRHAA